MNGTTAENRATTPIHVLKQLNALISSAVAAVEENLLSHHDPILSLDNLERHPIHDRDGQELSKQLKTISSAAQMLRALVDPNAYINDIMYGYHDQTALFIATQADIPNILGAEQLPVEVLSEKTGLNSDRLSRYLRNLCNCLIFKETAPNVFANNALSTIFKSEGKKALVGHCVDECRTSSCKAYEALIHPDYKDSNAPNRTAFNLAYNTDLTIFQYLAEVRPDIGARSKVAMSGKHLKLGDYLSLYPWDKESKALVVDVGGGVGGATQPIARAYPDLRIHIQDLPDSEAGFSKFWSESYPKAIEEQRVTFSAHNFFKPQPLNCKGAEVYFLRHVIHDWPDAEAIEILSHLAAAMTPFSKLLIVEHVVFPTYRQDDGEKVAAPVPLLANWGAAATSRLDLQVLACLNAKQRTTMEFEELADKSGLRVVRFWKNMGDLAFVECRLK